MELETLDDVRVDVVTWRRLRVTSHIMVTRIADDKYTTVYVLLGKDHNGLKLALDTMKALADRFNETLHASSVISYNGQYLAVCCEDIEVTLQEAIDLLDTVEAMKVAEIRAELDYIRGDDR